MDFDEVDYLCGSCGWHGMEDEAELEDMGTTHFCPECGADLDGED